MFDRAPNFGFHFCYITVRLKYILKAKLPHTRV